MIFCWCLPQLPKHNTWSFHFRTRLSFQRRAVSLGLCPDNNLLVSWLTPAHLSLLGESGFYHLCLSAVLLCRIWDGLRLLRYGDTEPAGMMAWVSPRTRERWSSVSESSHLVTGGQHGTQNRGGGERTCRGSSLGLNVNYLHGCPVWSALCVAGYVTKVTHTIWCVVNGDLAHSL